MSKVERMKKKAKKYYLLHQNIVSNYSCGLSLIYHLSCKANYYKDKFNEVMDELAKLDPTTPTERL